MRARVRATSGPTTLIPVFSWTGQARAASLWAGVFLLAQVGGEALAGLERLDDLERAAVLFGVAQRVNVRLHAVAGLDAGSRPAQANEHARARHLEQPFGRLVAGLDGAEDQKAHMRIDPAQFLDGSGDRFGLGPIEHGAGMVRRHVSDAGHQYHDRGDGTGRFDCRHLDCRHRGVAPNEWKAIARQAGVRCRRYLGATKLPPTWCGMGTKTA